MQQTCYFRNKTSNVLRVVAFHWRKCICFL
uniref:Uncharacterized protein n=1 Tax=Anguilla anguilla TaxID=7936 RepID=A0A0E9W915_ANGAN